MRRVIRMSGQASRDIDEHLASVAQHQLNDAMRLLDQVQHDCLHLAAVHGTGRRLETKNPALADVRSWALMGFENYILFYKPTSNGIDVIRVLHRSRDAED